MCMYCKCKTIKNSITTHVVNYKGCIIIVKNVPCEECEQCGATYYTNDVVGKLEQIINSAKQLKQEVAIYDYVIAA